MHPPSLSSSPEVYESLPHAGMSQEMSLYNLLQPTIVIPLAFLSDEISRKLMTSTPSTITAFNWATAFSEEIDSVISISKYSPSLVTPTPSTRKRHDHMRTVSGCKCDRYLCAPDCFLEITHHVQVSDETHDSIFTEFNSYFQHRHLLSILRHRSRNISYGSSVLLLAFIA